ncbi:nucleotidyltransferase family protein [Halarsenatibacter silvermanii]|uniref:Predicted nucleotidyltransferase n=1 Tax=Halarsenatibacter silvermanii TaxID=321763 RepID=A0A1G9TPV7_9FIRM|nr:nucleotidyltransferase domain-containing protein [Halarsenatibacter silvermanii]SDM49692.1 Predicted nucleotidyltransferase [Halarsenatibacter silvermanii]
MLDKKEIADEYKNDINKAIEILKDAGCEEIYLFGSLARGEDRKNADIDLAIRGCPEGVYFSLIGKLIIELEHSVDLVNLDKANDFAELLEDEGELVHVS